MSSMCMIMAVYSLDKDADLIISDIMVKDGGGSSPEVYAHPHPEKGEQ